MNYKATGIVRRVDDLGRVAIPKDIRRLLRIREGDPIEMFVGEDGSVKLKRYSPVAGLGDHTGLVRTVSTVLSDSTDCVVLITDDHEVIMSKGLARMVVGTNVGVLLRKFLEHDHDVESVTLPGSEVAGVGLLDDPHADLLAHSYHIRRIGTPNQNYGLIVVLSRRKEITKTDEAMVRMTATLLEKAVEESI